MKRPELKELKWLDSEGNSTEKGLAGKLLKMTASRNDDMEDGAWVVFRVYKEGANTKIDKPVFETSAEIKEGKAEAEWAYQYVHDPDNPLKEKPKYFFTANNPRCKEANSGNVEISANVDITIIDAEGKILGGRRFKLTMSGKTRDLQTKKDGSYQHNDVAPGYMTIEGITIGDNEDENEVKEYVGGEPRTPLAMEEGKSKAIVLPNWEKTILQIVSPLGKVTA